ncbi:MAG: hypothetical protein Kow0098_18320 [Ignavibacteriaceae bacterium]
MKHYIIDGNNVIGKSTELYSLQSKDKQQARVKLTFIVDRYFQKKKIKVTIHFDGFPAEPIKTGNVKIIYSENQTADERIKEQISSSKNRRNIVLVTSDLSLAEFGRKCSCEIMKSEKFTALISNSNNENEETARIREINDMEEFKKLFGASES